MVVGRPLVSMAVERHFDGVMVIMHLCMVVVFMESNNKNRYTSDRPQQ